MEDEHMMSGDMRHNSGTCEKRAVKGKGWWLRVRAEYLVIEGRAAEMGAAEGY